MYTGRVALAAMVSVGEWLGVEYTNRGVARILSTRIKNILVEAAEADIRAEDGVNHRKRSTRHGRVKLAQSGWERQSCAKPRQV